MLSRLSAFIHQAADQILTDSVPSNQDLFKDHWRQITDVITHPDNVSSISIITESLDSMLELLYKEEERIADLNDPGTVGPCMEFVLRYKVLDALCIAAKNDYPVGMAKQVLRFFSLLLSQLDRPLLHHVSIHQPILQQVRHCGEDPLALQTSDQVQFINTLCIQLSKNPGLTDFFVKDKGDHIEFCLSEALIRLTNSSDTIVGMKAFECLLTCVTMHHNSVTRALVSKLPMLLGSKLQYHFQLIPPSTAYTTILTCHVDWGPECAISCQSQDYSVSSEGIAHVQVFFSWLNYCNTVIASAQMPLGKILCDSIREIFLIASLLPKLFKPKEDEILLSISVLVRALQLITCRMFLEELVIFAMKSSFSALEGPESETLLLDRLIVSQSNHINEDVCRVTLQLFDTLLQLPFPVVIYEFTNCQTLANCCILQPETMLSIRLQLEEDVLSYLSVIPACLTSCKSLGIEDLEQYLRQAHLMVAQGSEFSKVSYTASHSHLEREHETPFICMLLNKFETLLDQPYEVNLLMTSILTRLAAIPYPVIEWLFRTHSNKRNVFTVLQKLAATLQIRLERTPGLLVHIIEARRRLSGQQTSDLLSMPHNNLLEGAIILEELVKELSAILYVKTTFSILALSER